ncbi:MAG: hypothetical protein ACREL7_09615 [Longimicrobiales bacterium]
MSTRWPGGPDSIESRKDFLDLLGAPAVGYWPDRCRTEDACAWASHNRALFDAEASSGVVARIFGIGPGGRRMVIRGAVGGFTSDRQRSPR